MKIDCHMHTPLCGHAQGLPREYVRQAAANGFDLITFTCHIPMNDAGFGGPRIRMSQKDLPEYRRLVDEARREGDDLGVEVLWGIEAEVFPDDQIMAAMDQTLNDHPFDFVLGSLHHHVPAYQTWIQEHGQTNEHQIIETYFEHLIQGARSGRYHSMAHPDVIRIYGTVARFDPANHQATIQRFLAAAVEQDICIEVNTSGLTKEAYEVHPDPLILDWAAPLGVKLTIGSDAHRPESVGQRFDDVVPMLKSKGFEKLHYHRGGERFAVVI